MAKAAKASKSTKAITTSPAEAMKAADKGKKSDGPGLAEIKRLSKKAHSLDVLAAKATAPAMVDVTEAVMAKVAAPPAKAADMIAQVVFSNLDEKPAIRSETLVFVSISEAKAREQLSRFKSQSDKPGNFSISFTPKVTRVLKEGFVDPFKKSKGAKQPNPQLDHALDEVKSQGKERSAVKMLEEVEKTNVLTPEEKKAIASIKADLTGDKSAKKAKAKQRGGERPETAAPAKDAKKAPSMTPAERLAKAREQKKANEAASPFCSSSDAAEYFGCDTPGRVQLFKQLLGKGELPVAPQLAQSGGIAAYKVKRADLTPANKAAVLAKLQKWGFDGRGQARPGGVDGYVTSGQACMALGFYAQKDLFKRLLGQGAIPGLEVVKRTFGQLTGYEVSKASLASADKDKIAAVLAKNAPKSNKASSKVVSAARDKAAAAVAAVKAKKNGQAPEVEAPEVEVEAPVSETVEAGPAVKAAIKAKAGKKSKK